MVRVCCVDGVGEVMFFVFLASLHDVFAAMLASLLTLGRISCDVVVGGCGSVGPAICIRSERATNTRVWNAVAELLCGRCVQPFVRNRLVIVLLHVLFISFL